jgi:hypothetical protein
MVYKYIIGLITREGAFMSEEGKEEEKQEERIGLVYGAGAILGVGIGAAVGVGMDDMTTGLWIGGVIGIGLAMLASVFMTKG